jgi:hypothetical protein
MALTQQALSWLRDLGHQAGSPTWDPRSFDDDLLRDIVLMAQQTPAWVEPYRAIVGLLVERGADLLAEPPIASCPQVVDVNFPTVALSRAEWRDGGLYLTLAPRTVDPDAWTMFRVVGVEPRLWDLHAPDGTTYEATARGIHVRTRKVAADIEFTPGSY